MKIPRSLRRCGLPGLLGATLLFAAAASPARAQEARAQAPPARLSDVVSLDAIIKTLYDVISGPAGQPRDWDRFRSLFLPGARLVSTGRDQQNVPRYRSMTPDEYVEASAQQLSAIGFMEREIARRVESFGNITHAFSTYESKFRRQGQDRTARGINSIQLYNDGTRWWVVNIFWDSERPDNPIPARYLTSGS